MGAGCRTHALHSDSDSDKRRVTSRPQVYYCPRLSFDGVGTTGILHAPYAGSIHFSSIFMSITVQRYIALQSRSRVRNTNILYNTTWPHRRRAKRRAQRVASSNVLFYLLFQSCCSSQKYLAENITCDLLSL